MESNEIIVPKEQLQSLLNENRQMKEDIKESVKVFRDLRAIIDLNEGTTVGTLTLKIPQLIHKFMKNPELIEKIIAHINKIQKYLPDENTDRKQLS